jgi:fatty-acyl-CoA synthase
LITAESLKTSDYIAMLGELLPEVPGSKPGNLNAAKLPDLKWLIRLGKEKSPGFLNFEDIPAMAREGQLARLQELEGQLQFDDPINIQFTSGTTGAPKASTLTHHNIVNNAYFSGLQMKLGPEDRMCIPVPMYHCFGMVLGTLVCVAHGSTMVFASPGFDAHAVLEILAREKCTVLHGVPTMFIAELDEPDFKTFDLTSLRTGIMAGAPCPVELMKQVMKEMHLTEITIAYGMTETGPLSFQTSVDDPVERRVTTVGRVLPHIEIKIVDDEGPLFFGSTEGFAEIFDHQNDPSLVIVDFMNSRVVDQSALQAIETLASKCESLGKTLQLRHLSRDCHRVLNRTGQLIVDSDDDPNYGLAVDYSIKTGILGAGH